MVVVFSEKKMISVNSIWHKVQIYFPKKNSSYTTYIIIYLVQSSAEKVYRKFVQLKLASCGLNARQRLYRCGLCGGDKSTPFHFYQNEDELNEKNMDIAIDDILQEQKVQYLIS
jgi:hypothetical protein